MKRSSLLLAGVAALSSYGLAGCTVGPDFMRPDKPKIEGYTPEVLGLSGRRKSGPTVQPANV